jgi:predicted outer membrane repeat protein
MTGDIVEVACGIYYEHSIMMKSGVILRSATGAAECVTIDAQRQGRILDCINLDSQTSILGLTLSHGLAPEGSFPTNNGGGVRCYNCTLSFKNCDFIDNSAQIGGALGIWESAVLLDRCRFTLNIAADQAWAAGGAIWCRLSSPVLQHCFFTSNYAFSIDTPGDGGAIFSESSSLTAEDCTLLANFAGAGAGGMYSYNRDQPVLTRCHFEGNSANFGGGMYLEESEARLDECAFHANTALAGGAIYMGRWSTPELNHCVFVGNAADQWGGGAIDCWLSSPALWRCRFRGNAASGGGGGMRCADTGNPRLEECSFFENQTPGQGGGLWCQHTGNLQIISCTFAGNSATRGGGIACEEDGLVSLRQTILAFSPLGEGVSAIQEGTIALACCDIYGNEGGDWVFPIASQLGIRGNFSADPLFCEELNPDEPLTLAIESPCTADNNPLCGLVGAFPAGCAITGIQALVQAPGEGCRLHRCFPNPFNPVVTIMFEIPGSEHVRLSIHTSDGRLVDSLIDETLHAGRHTVRWNGQDSRNRPIPSGLYLYRLQAGESVKTGTMLCVR